MNNQYCFIINPMAGNQAVKRKWPKIEAMIVEALDNPLFLFTEYRGHGIELAKQAIEKGYRKLIAVGGDGTNNEVINGIFSTKTHSYYRYILYPATNRHRQ